VGCGFVATIAASLLTEKTDEKILIRFWHQINPWGFWGKYEQKAKEKELVTEAAALERQLERLNDVVALAFALPFQLSLLLAGMSFVWHDWKKFAFFMTIMVFTSIGLYFFWYRNLKDDEVSAAEDDYFDDLAFGELAPVALAATGNLVDEGDEPGDTNGVVDGE
jgi:hypothetical protein